MQILHAGRYGYQPLVVSASDKKRRSAVQAARTDGSRRNHHPRLRALPNWRAMPATTAWKMGSEGYLLNQFLVRAPICAPTAGAAASKTACACRWKSSAYARSGP
jgi:hypothetical protein